MAISLASLKRTNVLTPPRVLVYGVAGVGKTSLAANAPSPVLIQTEDGAGLLDVPTFGLMRSFGDMMGALASLYTEDHEFKTVVFDSLDWAESLIWTETCARNGWKNIEEAGFGKGYVATADVWRELLDGFTALRDDKGMTVILIAHCDVKRFESPETTPFDRYLVKLHKVAAALVQEHVDAVFFNQYRVSIVKDQGKGDKKGEGHARGVGGGQRVIYTQERPAYLAKNRYNMPPSIDLPDDPAAAWTTLAAHIPYFTTPSKS